MSTSISESRVLDTLPDDLTFVVFDTTAKAFARYSGAELKRRWQELAELREAHGLTAEALERLASQVAGFHDPVRGTAVIVGQDAGQHVDVPERSVIIGYRAGQGGLLDFAEVTLLGANAQALASQTTSLGDSTTQVHTVHPVATRADRRDFTAFQDLELGLEFLLRLHPQVAQPDLREDYIDYAAMPLPPTPPGPPPPAPTLDKEDPAFPATWARYQEALAPWLQVNGAYQQTLQAWQRDYEAWRQRNDPSCLVPDGQHTRPQARTLLLSDDLQQAARAVNGEFTGLWRGQEHHGLDVDTVRAEELIPVLVKAIQQLHGYITSDAYLDRVAARMVQQTQAARAALRQQATSRSESEKQS